jgi:hypothetical protein
VPDPGQHAQLGVREERVEPVGPRHREQRLELAPEDGRRHRDAILRRGRALGQRVRHRAGAGPVPGDARAERSRPRVERDELVEVPGVKRPAGRAPVLPEVRQVRADRARVAVDERIGEFQLVEGLVPELALGVGGEDPLADAGQRRRDTSARTAAGRRRAIAWATRLPTS